MKARLTITIDVEYEDKPEVKSETPSAQTQYLKINKLCYEIASIFGKVINRANMRHSFSREIVYEDDTK